MAAFPVIEEIHAIYIYEKMNVKCRHDSSNPASHDSGVVDLNDEQRNSKDETTHAEHHVMMFQRHRDRT